MKPITIFSCLMLLASCGGSDDAATFVNGDPVYNSTGVGNVQVNSYGSGSVPSPLNPFSTGHFCPTPVLSGSPEQQACFEEAQKVCPEGLSPAGQVEFEQQANGEFLIKGYGCA